MDKSLTGRQQQAIQTKGRILEATRKLVGEKPISDITIQDITAASGTSIGTFYHYFSSKENICASIALAPGTEITEDIRHGHSLSIIDKLRRFVMGRLQLADTDGLSFTRNVQAFRLTEAYRGIRKERYGDGHYDYTALIQIITEAISRKELSSNFPTETFAQTLVYLVHGAIYNKCLYDESMQLSQWGEDFCDYMETVMLSPYLLPYPGTDLHKL